VRKKFLVALFLAAVSVILFLPALGGDFVFDDQFLVTDKSAVGGLTRDGVTWALQNNCMAMYVPVARLSQVLDCEFYGLSSWGHHLTNLLVHAANCALLFLVLGALTGATWRSAAAALLFAIHPLNVEPVAWVSGRPDLLAGLFFLLTLLAWRTYLRRPGWLRSLLAAGLFTLGMMSKVIIMTLPFALLLLDYWPFGRFGRPGADVADGGSSTPRQPERIGRINALLLEKTTLFLVTATMVVVSLVLLKQGALAVPTEHYPLTARVATSLVSYAAYLGKALWPSGLTVFYPHAWGDYPWWKPAGSGVLLIGVTAGSLLLARRRPYLVVGWFWFLGTLFPVIGLLQARQYPYADRYAYLPVIGLFVMAVWGFADLVRGRRWGNAACAAAMAAIVAACFPVSRAQVGTWKDNITLYSHALDVTEGNAAVQHALATELRARGRLEEAIVHNRAAVALRPESAEFHFDFAAALQERGDLAGALDEYRAAQRINPAFPQAGYNVGLVLLELGRAEEALPNLVQAMWARPGDGEIRRSLGTAYVRLGRLAEAVEAFRTATAVAPGLADAWNDLGSALGNLGRLGEAAAAFEEALRCDPRHEKARGNLELLRRHGG